MKVLIVGAGIAGAALAVALGRRGLCPTLIERRSALTDVGAGVVLGPNVMAALGPLGLDAAVRAVGQPVAAFSLRDARGRLLQRSAYAAPGLPPFGVGLHRAALHATLLSALPSPARLGCALVEMRPLPGPQGGVEATLSDGAGLAIEDAACLAAILTEDGPTDAALAKFQALRQPRARWICQQSATLGRVGALRSAPLRALRDLALRCTPPAIAAASLRRVLLDMPGVPLRGALNPPSV